MNQIVLGERGARPIARQVAEALEHAHDHGVIHRDLKTGSIKLTSGEIAKVLDFGLAKAPMDEPAAADPLGSRTLSRALALAGAILGTAAHMSPEQGKGQAGGSAGPHLGVYRGLV